MLRDYERETIKKLRVDSRLSKYLDSEIAFVYSMYCEQNHAASWTEVNIEDFITWATESPLDAARRRGL